MMNEVEKLRARRNELLKGVVEAPFWVHGSVVETTRKSRNKEIPFYYLSQSIKGKNKITYISAAHLEQFKTAASEGAKIRLLQNELSSINMKLIKQGCSDD
jgi:hypothetical protein